jgi:hypothetical protein
MEKHLEDVRTLIKENILPRLDALDADMFELRRVTWPVCQGQRDAVTGGPFSNLNAKARFLRFLHIDDVRELLRRKAVYMGIFTPTLVEEELSQILVCQ